MECSEPPPSSDDRKHRARLTVARWWSLGSLLCLPYYHYIRQRALVGIFPTPLLPQCLIVIRVNRRNFTFHWWDVKRHVVRRLVGFWWSVQMMTLVVTITVPNSSACILPLEVGRLYYRLVKVRKISKPLIKSTYRVSVCLQYYLWCLDIKSVYAYNILAGV